MVLATDCLPSPDDLGRTTILMSCVPDLPYPVIRDLCTQ